MPTRDRLVVSPTHRFKAIFGNVRQWVACSQCDYKEPTDSPPSPDTLHTCPKCGKGRICDPVMEEKTCYQ